MTKQVARRGESSLTIPASVVVRDLLEGSDQESVSIVKTHGQHRSAHFVIVGWEVGQDEVTVGLHRVSCNTLFEMSFKQRQMLVGQPVTQTRTLGKEGLLKLAGFTHVVSHMRTPMHSDAAEEATVVLISVQGQNSVLVAQPIRKATETEEQRVAVQDDFDVHPLSLLVDPFGVGPSLLIMLKSQLFLLGHPDLRLRKRFEPRRRLKVLVVERHRVLVLNVSQRDPRSERELETRSDLLLDLAVDRGSDEAFHINASVSVEAKLQRSPASSIPRKLRKVVQWIELSHNDVWNSTHPYETLLFIKPSN